MASNRKHKNGAPVQTGAPGGEIAPPSADEQAARETLELREDTAMGKNGATTKRQGFKIATDRDEAETLAATTAKQWEDEQERAKKANDKTDNHVQHDATKCARQAAYWQPAVTMAVDALVVECQKRIASVCQLIAESGYELPGVAIGHTVETPVMVPTASGKMVPLSSIMTDEQIEALGLVARTSEYVAPTSDYTTVASMVGRVLHGAKPWA